MPGGLLGRAAAPRGVTVTVAHDLAADTRSVDGVVAATGVRDLVGAEHVEPGATVIDAGIHRTPDGHTGDVRADGLDGIASRTTPLGNDHAGSVVIVERSATGFRHRAAEGPPGGAGAQEHEPAVEGRGAAVSRRPSAPHMFSAPLLMAARMRK
ncbi:hypothetical protein ACIBBD_35195 [Streptomyces sp. NPDC051315]|uniref:hypothetical protein n=1 Tax=Streptomyces sp. NPDC051315 TaxID=3365650 RepID=UPI0037A495DC